MNKKELQSIETSWIRALNNGGCIVLTNVFIPGLRVGSGKRFIKVEYMVLIKPEEGEKGEIKVSPGKLTIKEKEEGILIFISEDLIVAMDKKISSYKVIY